MKLKLTQDRAIFQHGPLIAGIGVLDDPFKPWFHPLRTPAGHIVTNAMPMDHRHHKGLMYSLRCADLNFWEENPGMPDCGVQEVLSHRAEKNVLTLELLWRAEKGGLETYRELRRISCAPEPSENGFVWTWLSHREALRDHRLIQSQWSYQMPDGRKINYHGLGIRLPWAWSFPDDHLSDIYINGKPIPAVEACGLEVPEITWRGRIDGYWTPPVASVTIRQHQKFTWFVLKGNFAYLSVGPSNRADIDVKRGEIFDETYQVCVRDIS